jgi:membrane protease subunit (stomatin/prohibitin family)
MSGAWQILGLSVHSPEIETQSLQGANAQLAEYGLSVPRLGNLDINLDDDDNARLKKLAGDTAYSRLAGGFLQAAQAEALQGAGEGLAKGGGADASIFLGAGLGIANQMMQAPQQQPYPPPQGPGFAGGGGQGYGGPPPPGPGYGPPQAPPSQATTVATAECVNCHSQVRIGAKFCDSCGHPMSKHCTNCNAELTGTAKFCAECGTPTAPPQG